MFNDVLDNSCTRQHSRAVAGDMIGRIVKHRLWHHDTHGVSYSCWRNGTDRGKPEYSEKIPFQWHFVHHKSHMHWPGIEPAPLLWKASDWSPEPKHSRNFNWKVRPKLLAYRIQGTRRNDDEMCYTGLFWGQSAGKMKVLNVLKLRDRDFLQLLAAVLLSSGSINTHAYWRVSLNVGQLFTEALK